MTIPTHKRVIAPLILFTIAALMLVSAHHWLSRASAIPQSQSETAQAVITARQALETALASEAKNPVPEAGRTTDLTFFQYKSAIDNRLADLRTLQAELRKGDTSGASAARIAELERECAELEKSLTNFFEEVKTVQAFRKPAGRAAAPTVVFPGTGITLNTGTPPVTSTPYPSTINVSGLTGTITNMTVTLTGLTTTRPDDFDFLLVSPSGANAIIMSDVGGTSCANCPVTLVIDDAAATQLPNNSPPTGTGLVSGTFRPANFTGEASEVFPAPAPAPSGNVTLSTFNGTAPNGTWSLYISNDGGTVGGSISSWSLDITAGAGACTLTCPSNVMQAKNANFCGAIVTYAAPTTSGACGTITCTPPSNSFFPVGTTTVACSETGGANCSFTVTVTGTCGAGQPCNNSSITINDNAVASPYPSTINVSGLMGQIVSSVTVTLANFSHGFPDDVDVLLVGPQGQTAIIMSDVGSNLSISPNAPVTLTLDDAAASSLPDAGMLSTGTFKPTNVDPGAVADVFPAPAPMLASNNAMLSVFNGTDPNGTWSLYIVDDGASNAGLFAGGWCLNITATTPTPCTLMCPANVTQAKDANFCGAVVSYSAPTPTGNCGVITCTPPSGSFFPVSTTTVTCTEPNNSATCSFTVTVTGTCGAGQPCNNNSITINDNAVASPYPSTINVSGLTGVIGKVTVTLGSFSHAFPDDVDILLVAPGGQEATIMSDVGGSNPISASNPVTLTLDDAAASSLSDTGMLSTGTFKPTNINPGAVPDVFPAPAPSPSGGSALSAFNGADPNGTWSLYVVDDGAGSAGLLAGGWCLNITTVCAITCPMPITVGNDPNQCGAVVNFAPTPNGNCGTITCTPPSGSFFPVGTTTVSCTEPNNSATCSFTITVNDTQAPTIMCPSNIGASTLAGCATVTYTDPTPVDNCPGAMVVCAPPSGTCFALGTTTVTCTATDAAGNMGNCTFTVTVAQCAITCPANVVQGNDVGLCSAVVNFSPPMTTGDCGTVNCAPPSGSLFPVGVTTVTCTTTVGPSCSFTVTVNDTEPPAITCPPTAIAAPGVVTYPDPTVSDNCMGATFACVPASGSVFPLGMTTVTCTAMDAAGNTAMCTFTVATFNVSVTGSSGVLLVNTTTGDYVICCGGMIVSGKGRMKVKGCTLTLEQGATETDRRLLATINTCQQTGTATLQMPPGQVKCSITDNQVGGGIFTCPTAP